jgi:dihydroxyacid dehydratase/phosphogluconate dehydratase
MSNDSGGGRELSPEAVFDSDVENLCRVVTASPGPRGQLPLTAEDLIGRPRGDIFGWTQDVGMGWNPAQLRRPEVLILSTQGGIRLPDGTPLALGYHTGHYEGGLLMQSAAEELYKQGYIPFAGYCTDPCDGRTQGTTGPARVFTTERATIAAIKSQGDNRIKAGEVIVLICRGPLGAGMEEVYQITSALKYMPYADTVALITDARFSGVSSGPCIGHVAPEALADGPLGKVRDGDLIRVVIDPIKLEGSIDLVEESAPGEYVPADATLAARMPRPDLRPDPALPADTRLWAALQNASGGPWRGSVYDVDRILRVIEAGLRTLDS